MPYDIDIRSVFGSSEGWTRKTIYSILKPSWEVPVVGGLLSRSLVIRSNASALLKKNMIEYHIEGGQRRLEARTRGGELACVAA